MLACKHGPAVAEGKLQQVLNNAKNVQTALTKQTGVQCGNSYVCIRVLFIQRPVPGDQSEQEHKSTTADGIPVDGK